MVGITARATAILVGLIASPVMAATGFATGMWEHQTTLLKAEVPGIPEWMIKLAAGRGTRTNCNSEAQAQSHPEALLQGDDTAICKTRNFGMSNGKLVYDTFCTNRHFPDGLLVSSRGTYTPTSYSISTVSTGMKSGKPVRIVTNGAGKRVSAICEKS